MKIAVVYGTRPEAIKLAPVVEELRRRNVEPTIISTGQHTSLLRGTPAESTMAPHVNLNLPSDNDPTMYAERCRGALRAHWREFEKPDLVFVQGDTASAYAGAEAAYSAAVPLAHVEAGIRTGDFSDPWPEEHFRVEIDRTAEWHFCATQGNFLNLCNTIAWTKVTGNSGIDALYAHTQPTMVVLDRVMITLHRRESFGEPLMQIAKGIETAAKRHPRIEFEWPMHPNPEVLRATDWIFGGDGAGVCAPGNLASIDPLSPVQFARILRLSRAVITDSGGVQEEAAALGIPCIVAREKTDRPESVEAGLAKVVGRTEQGILDGLDWALGFSTRPDPSHCFGDGKAAPRIVQHLLETA
jgi:UDP-N-acetylglucosamine 2-epimerase (non-hydrolysing)